MQSNSAVQWGMNEGWGYGSDDKVLALQAQGPELSCAGYLHSIIYWETVLE